MSACLLYHNFLFFLPLLRLSYFHSLSVASSLFIIFLYLPHTHPPFLSLFAINIHKKLLSPRTASIVYYLCNLISPWYHLLVNNKPTLFHCALLTMNSPFEFRGHFFLQLNLTWHSLIHKQDTLTWRCWAGVFPPNPNNPHHIASICFFWFFV